MPRGGRKKKEGKKSTPESKGSEKRGPFSAVNAKVESKASPARIQEVKAQMQDEQMEEIRAHSQAMTMKLLEVQNELNEVNAAHKKVLKERNGLKEQVTELEQSAASHQEEGDQADEIEALKATMASVNEDNSTLRGQLEALQAHIEQLEEDAETVEDKRGRVYESAMDEFKAKQQVAAAANDNKDTQLLEKSLAESQERLWF